MLVYGGVFVAHMWITHPTDLLIFFIGKLFGVNMSRLICFCAWFNLSGSTAANRHFYAVTFAKKKFNAFTLIMRKITPSYTSFRRFAFVWCDLQCDGNVSKSILRWTVCYTWQTKSSWPHTTAVSWYSFLQQMTKSVNHSKALNEMNAWITHEAKTNQK